MRGKLTISFSSPYIKVPRYRPKEYDLEDGPWDPISGGASALLGTLASLVIGIAVMPNGIFRALKVKSAETSDEQFTTTNNNNTTPLKAPKGSTSLILPEEPSLSQGPIRQSYSLESALFTTKSKSNEILENSGTTWNDTFGAGIKRKRQRRLRRAWLLGHRKTPSKPVSKEVALTDNSCFLNSSDTPRCLSPVPNNLGLRDRTDTASTDHKECQLASKFALEKTSGSRNSAARIMVASLKFPIDFALHVAKGFHNAPKLYGDDTVRSIQKINGLKTGLKSSGRVLLTLYIYVNANINRSLFSVFTTVFQE